MFSRMFKTNDSHEFRPILAEIEDDPGSPLGRFTFWVIVAVFGFFTLWLCLGQIDIVVSARGKVIPVGDVKVIQPLETGVVSRILVEEGEFVKKGQSLVVIDPSTTAPGLESSEKNLEQIQLEKERLLAEATGQPYTPVSEKDQEAVAMQQKLHQASTAALNKQLQAKHSYLNSLSSQQSAKQVDLNKNQSLLEVAEAKEQRLAAVLDIIAKDEYEKVRNEVLTYQNRVAELRYELQELQHQQSQVYQEMAYLEANYQENALNTLSDKQKQITQIEADIEETAFKNARQTLKAPVDGYINELTVHTVGGVVTPAEKILSIVPVKTPLLVEATVLNKDIGFIKEGMPVAIKVDTFDFQKYGTLKGIVRQIAKNSVDDKQQGPVYTVLVTPVDKSLVVEGRRKALSTGLSLTSEIKVGKRRIIEFFIYPLIKHLDEGMSVR